MVSEDFYISIAIMAFFLILFALFSYQSIKKGRKAYILTFGLLLGVLGAFFALLKEALPLSSEISSLFLHISLIIYSFQYFTVYIFLEQLEELRPKVYRLVIMVLFILLSIVFSIITWINLPGPNPEIVSFNNISEYLWDFFYNGLGILIFTFGAYVFYKIIRATHEKESIFLWVGMVTLSLGFFVSLLGDTYSFLNKNITLPEIGFFENALLIGDLVKILGMLIFIVVFIVKIDYIYRIPQDVYSIFIFTGSGICLYVAHTENSENIRIDEDLMSGVLTAISTLMQETFRSKISDDKGVNEIYTEKKVCLVERENFSGAAVLCSKITYFLKCSLKNLVDAFETNYIKELEEKNTELAVYDGAAKIVTDNFPYVRILK
ncbi:MAG: hypothetical protein ACFFD2_17025 [Promethearchaeota archaeon]